MLFGGARGLLVIDPERFVPWTYKPPLVISELRVDGAERAMPAAGQPLVLAAGERAFSLAFATAFGSSRLLLGFHSPADVLVGAAIGIAGTVMMVSRLQPFGFNPSVERLPALMVVASTLVLILHGCRLPAELMLRTHHEIFLW